MSWGIQRNTCILKICNLISYCCNNMHIWNVYTQLYRKKMFLHLIIWDFSLFKKKKKKTVTWRSSTHLWCPYSMRLYHSGSLGQVLKDIQLWISRRNMDPYTSFFEQSCDKKISASSAGHFQAKEDSWNMLLIPR